MKKKILSTFILLFFIGIILLLFWKFRTQNTFPNQLQINQKYMDLCEKWSTDGVTRKCLLSLCPSSNGEKIYWFSLVMSDFEGGSTEIYQYFDINWVMFWEYEKRRDLGSRWNEIGKMRYWSNCEEIWKNNTTKK